VLVALRSCLHEPYKLKGGLQRLGATAKLYSRVR
jgi:hypothetical protein